MRKATYLWRALVLAAVIVLAAATVAQATVPAPDWRGQEGSTYQKWTFDTNANPALPEVDSNPYGDPIALITLGDLADGWQLGPGGLGTQTGYWDLGIEGAISIDVPNRPFDGGIKELWISVIYFEDEGFMAAPVVDVVSGGHVVTFLGEETFLVEEDPISGQWNAHLTKWLIVPNPDSEQGIIISRLSSSVIDQIEIDTICVPEPAICAALLIGGPFLLLLRRRKA